MKQISFSVCFLILVLVISGCRTSSGVNVGHSQENALSEQVDSMNFIFVPSMALPMSGKSIPLNYSYSLQIKPDTIKSYLPYYGRAYVAPSPSEEGGVTFTSVDFDYNVEKKKDGWEVKILIKDSFHKYTMNLAIGENGYSTLRVSENNRQQISYYGNIDLQTVSK